MTTEQPINELCVNCKKPLPEEATTCFCSHECLREMYKEVFGMVPPLVKDPVCGKPLRYEGENDGRAIKCMVKL